MTKSWSYQCDLQAHLCANVVGKLDKRYQKYLSETGSGADSRTYLCIVRKLQ